MLNEGTLLLCLQCDTVSYISYDITCVCMQGKASSLGFIMCVGVIKYRYLDFTHTKLLCELILTFHCDNL